MCIDSSLKYVCEDPINSAMVYVMAQCGTGDYFTNQLEVSADRRGPLELRMGTSHYLITTTNDEAIHFRLYTVDGLVQERRNSGALAMELRLSCINPSMLWRFPQVQYNDVR